MQMDVGGLSKPFLCQNLHTMFVTKEVKNNFISQILYYNIPAHPPFLYFTK
jgi:hypothetical protein